MWQQLKGDAKMKRCVLLLGVVIALVALETSASAQAIIPGVPRIDWYGGCSPTAAGMILEYWASHPYWSGLITTSINDAIGSSIGSQGVNSYEHDYWTGSGLTDPGPLGSNDPASDPDPYLLGPPSSVHLPGNPEQWDAHQDNSIADFMHTSRSLEGYADGDTSRKRIASGVMAYANNQGYDAASWLANVAQYDPPGDPAPLTWEAYKAEIDQGYPVLISVRNFYERDPETDSPIIQGHSVVGYGYQDDMFQVRYFIGPESGDPNDADETDLDQWVNATVGGMAVMDTWPTGTSGSSWLDWDGTSEVFPQFTDIYGVSYPPSPPPPPD
jgi:hypothetical protein